jgi:hypothetical protein
MHTFTVVQTAEEPSPEWAIEWAAHGAPPLLIPRRFGSAEEAQHWSDKLNELEADGRPLPR